MQILTEEPARPRTIRPDLPRDLETIIQTCLAKDASARYQTAQALVEDLRAVMLGAPIRARRVSVGERVTRYLKKRRASLERGAMVGTATAALLVGAILGWRLYQQALLGGVVLTADGPPLTAQVLSFTDAEPVGDPIAVGEQRTVRSITEGEYQVRVEGPGLSSETFDLAVERGDSRTYHLALDADRLLGRQAIPYSFASDAIEISAGKSDLVGWDGERLVRRDGATGKPVWDAANPATPWDPKRDPVAWMRRLSYGGDDKRPGLMVQPALDLDGDGLRDIVWAFHGTPSLLALSGKDGSMLWTFTADIGGPGGPDPDGPDWPKSVEQVPQPGRLMGTPSAVDVDRDGVLETVTMFAVFDDGPPVLRRAGANASVDPKDSNHRARRVVSAVSGKSGKAIWNYQIDANVTALEVDPFDCGATLISTGSQATVSFVDGSRWFRIETASGKRQRDPIELGFTPVRPVQYADLDGDGVGDIVALGTETGTQLVSGNSDGTETGAQLVYSISGSTGKRIWQAPVDAAYDDPKPPLVMRWPIVADLDGDGRSEVVVPARGGLGTNYGFEGLRLIEGATGKTRWVQPMRPETDAHDGVEHLVEAPDLDADGTRDLIAVSRYNGRHPRLRRGLAQYDPMRIYVDAFSGKDGRRLWWWSKDVKDEFGPPSLLVWPPQWWGRGEDGWPLLAIPLGGRQASAFEQTERNLYRELPEVHRLLAGSGRELHRVSGLSWPKAADLDGDGLVDLWGSVEGTTRAYAGGPPQSWQAIGDYQKVGDLDGDGVADVVNRDLRLREGIHEKIRQNITTDARSGRDGRILWKCAFGDWGASFRLNEQVEEGYRITPLTLPAGDLDGDGVADLGVTRVGAYNNKAPATAPLALDVVSGRSGQILWSAADLPSEFTSGGLDDIESVSLINSAAGEPGDLIVLVQGTLPARPNETYRDKRETRLARVSGRDGAVRYAVALAQKVGQRVPAVYAFGDCDGDGSPDIVMLLQVDGPAGRSMQRRAVSLADGKTIWTHDAAFHEGVVPSLAVGDLDADGRAEVVVRYRDAKTPAGFVLTVLDGRDGSIRWTHETSVLEDALDPKRKGFCLADLDGKRSLSVCLLDRTADGRARVLVLDAQGKQRAQRDLEAGVANGLTRADLEGDGKDELLFHDGGRLCATRGDLKDVWSRPGSEAVREVIAGKAEGESAIVVLESMVGLDGKTGSPRWSGQGASELLDAGSTKEPPRVLVWSADTTSCRLALATRENGLFEEASGSSPEPYPIAADPRWARRLPWNDDFSLASWVLMAWNFGVIAGLMFVWPLAILKLVCRGRLKRLRTLMVLPVIVAPALLAFVIAFYSGDPVVRGLEWRQMIIGPPAAIVVGFPILKFIGLVAQNVFQWRLADLAVVLGGTMVAAMFVAGGWLWWDYRQMPSIERYAWSEWYLVFFPAAYLVGAVATIGETLGLALTWWRRSAWRGRVGTI